MANILLFGHGGSANHGCEAIVRTTAGIIKDKLPDSKLFLCTPKINEDQHYSVDKICILKNVSQNIKNFDFYISYLKYRFTHNFVYLDTYRYNSLVRRLRKERSFALSIGGDNYCYGENKELAYLNNYFNKHGIKTILWGCSVEPSGLDNPNILNDMKNYTYIISRESLTFEAMKSHGLNNVYLYPDPAFLLKKEQIDDHNLIKENTVGINLSPYILKCEGKKGITIKNFVHLIEYILENTSMNVALIPHVVWSHSNDCIPLQLLCNEFKNNQRVSLIGDASASELKGLISKCRFMIAARTHASIAAYSSCVPTLVVGYSVKAKGIAKDIFGTYDRYVLPVQTLSDEKELVESFQWLVCHETEIRTHLIDFMPQYIEKANVDGEILYDML
ncbi:MAG: polysaccharide pyruvyl transferase family protein [Phocaeicola sp.]|uniref:polysaccharide pyruvyl transferase family protein n=1 Tax=Phocaeicola TaxID=909656 RepID=UPI00234E8145|nr:polysaccharide pyruvyl transferase family protein [Phocaeicola oris]MCE2617199.1 polysaccharide pyruvyl transferase family protein [Phocaeicola oris]